MALINGTVVRAQNGRTTRGADHLRPAVGRVSQRGAFPRGGSAVMCADRRRRPAPIDVRRYARQLGEVRTEDARREAADRTTGLRDAEVAVAQQDGRAFDTTGHQVCVRRPAVGQPELLAEQPGRHVRGAGERFDVQWLRVLPVDPVAYAAQSCEVAQALRRDAGAPPRGATHVSSIPSASVQTRSAAAWFRPTDSSPLVAVPASVAGPMAERFSGAPGCGPGCPPDRGRRSRGCRTAARSAPGRPRCRSTAPSRTWRRGPGWPAGSIRRCPWPSSR